MFQAVCVECGERCEVPFKPVNGKPVFCQSCFRKEDRGGNDRSFQPRRDDRYASAPKQHDNRSDFEQLNRKLDTIIELLRIAQNQPPKEIKVHTVASEAIPETAKVKDEPKSEEPKASKKKTVKAAATKADKKKKK